MLWLHLILIPTPPDLADLLVHVDPDTGRDQERPRESKSPGMVICEDRAVAYCTSGSSLLRAAEFCLYPKSVYRNRYTNVLCDTASFLYVVYSSSVSPSTRKPYNTAHRKDSGYDHSLASNISHFWLATLLRPFVRLYVCNAKKTTRRCKSQARTARMSESAVGGAEQPVKAFT